MCEFKIDTDEIIKNLQKVKNKLNSGTKTCGIVKANAYGFGLDKICELIKDKVDYFAVARLNEFLDLKRLGNNKPCLILSPLYDEELKTALQEDAEITISTNSDITILDNLAKTLNKKAKVHLKVDTGMNRFGYNDFSFLRKVLKQLKTLNNIEVVGLYSHFYDTLNKEAVLKQRSKFIFYKKLVNKYGFNPICHISSSKALIDKLNQFDMVRLGFDLYYSNKHELISKVLEVKKIKKGDSVGYLGKFVANKDLEIAVCEGGYADGILRRLDKSYVLINGEKCKIIGNICMDSFMVLAPKNKININDKVTIFGKNQEKFISVCDIAKLCDTIPYEIYLSISKQSKKGVCLMQIITGKYKGRKLISLETEKTRPTLARVKESIFSIIQNYISGAIVLDLFAGSGAMGIESISEGADKVYFVDHNKDYKKVLDKNLINVKEPYEILISDYQNALNLFKAKNIEFDLVFLDPPYDSDYGENAISLLRDLNLLTNDAIIVFEQTSKKCLQNEPKGFIIEKSRKYGLASVTILKYTGD